MPKNTYFIKENLAKIEEVREIENQIPTYEEFLKNYNASEKVNYEDLTHDDISLNKGFGPCSWNNPNCDCYISEGFIPLYVGCSTGSWNCRNTTPTTWFHSFAYRATTDQSFSCGKLLISKEGLIKCTSCVVEADWKEWIFSCSNHPENYNSFSRDEFIHSLTMSMNLHKNSNYIKSVMMQRLIVRLTEDR